MTRAGQIRGPNLAKLIDCALCLRDWPWTVTHPWTPRTRPPLLGKRLERVSHSSHRPPCKAVRSRVKRKRTDHLSTTEVLSCGMRPS
jgi:hypothetical protein